LPIALIFVTLRINIQYKHMKRRLTAFAAGGILACGPVFAQGGLHFTEILQSNITVKYEWPEFPDSWIELHNASDQPVDMTAWRVGESDFASAWPAGISILNPGEYALLYCDKVADGQHADFRLNSGKGQLYLFNPQGEIADQLSYPKQPVPNTAYALTDTGWSYVVKPTAGRANTEPAASEVMPEPVFSRNSEVFTHGCEPFTVTISAPEGIGLPNDAILAVTTDGRRPMAENMVPNRSWTGVISESTVVRARFISQKALSPLTTTRSFIFTPEPTDLDVICLVSDPDYFFQEYLGILERLSTNSSNPRRPVHIEYFQGPDHKLIISQVGETRVHGGSNRTMPQKSLAVYSHKRFGKKGFSARLWDDKPQMEQVESFLLRNGGNSWPYQRFNDQLLQTLLGRAKTVEWQAYTPALYYINGRYMGIADVRERSNEHFINANLPEIAEFDMIENYSELKTGTMDHHIELTDYLNSDSVTFEGICRRVDIDNFLNLYATELFCQNHDFPQNNIVSWRPEQPDAKWRWVVKDLDDSGWWPRRDSVYNDYIDHIEMLCRDYAEKYGRNVKLFQLMYTLPEARQLLIDRVAVALGDYLRRDHAASVLDEMIEQVKPHYLGHMAVYTSDPQAYFDRWLSCNDYWINTWWPTRINSVYANLASRFKLGRPVPVKIRNETNLKPTVNDIELSLGDFNGKYFSGQKLTISAPELTKWSVMIVDLLNRATYYFSTASLLELTIPKNAISVEIKANNSMDAINDVETAPDSKPAVVFDLLGRPVTNPQRGIYIVNGQVRLMR